MSRRSSRIARIAMAMCLGGLLSTPSPSAEKLNVGPPAAWVHQPQRLTGLRDSEAAIQVLLNDQQIDITPTGIESFVETHTRINTSEGLHTLGMLPFSWNPATDVLTLHKVRVVRDGHQPRDLVANADSLTVLRREDRLEYSEITGLLTAVLQPAGVQVGDVLEVSYTLQRHDPLTAAHPEEDLIVVNSPIDQMRFRVQWDRRLPMRWQASEYLPGLTEDSTDDRKSISFVATQLEPLPQPTHAPARFVALRRLELTTSQRWADVASWMHPLYVKAASVRQDSPVRQEATRIRAMSRDPLARAGAALQLVQNNVRYVFTALNDGSLVPADADTTWERRYGDCKGKSVLLLALLRELQIEAQPALVSTTFGDGLDARLPGISKFDHVIVRATIDGRTYWLDGTRSGDANLANLQVPDFGWALPLQTRGGNLVRLVPQVPAEPLLDEFLQIDATRGIRAPARVTATTVFRGDRGHDLKLRLSNLTAAQRDEELRLFWRDSLESLAITSVDASHDEVRAETRVTMTGTTDMSWERNKYEADGMTVGGKLSLSRPAGARTDVPYAVIFPYFRRRTEEILLPEQRAPFKIEGDAIERTLGGIEYQRVARIEGQKFSSTVSVRSVAREYPAAEAKAIESGLLELSRKRLHVTAPDSYAATADEAAVADQRLLESANEYEWRGNSFMRTARFELAVSDFTKALAENERSAFSLGNRAMSYLHINRIDEARKDLNLLLQIDPDNVVGMRGRGVIAHLDRKYTEAVELFTKSLVQDKNPFAYEKRALSYAQLGEFDLALSDAREAARLEPGTASPQHVTLSILLRQGKRDEAESMVQELIRKGADDPESLATAAGLYRQLGNKAKALEAISSAISLAPTDVNYARRAGLQTDQQASAADIDRALEIKPDSLVALQYRAVLQDAQKDYAGLLKTLESLEKLNDKNVGRLLYRGIAYWHLDDRPRALDSFAQLRSEIRDAQLMNSTCWGKATRGVALEDALKDCDAAIAQAPGCAACLDSRGFVYLRLGQHAKSIADYDRALAVEPKQPASLYGRGIAKLRSGSTSEGDADLAAARALRPEIDQEFRNYGVTP